MRSERLINGKHGEQVLLRSPINDRAIIHHEYLHLPQKSFHMLHVAGHPLPTGTPVMF
jgi:hypothetical protein